MASMYERLGDILRDRLDGEEDPFETWEPHTGKPREAGNAKQRMPPPSRRKKIELVQIPPELSEDFSILALPAGSPLEECKASWKRLLKKYHPDMHNTSAKQQECTQISVRITNSYRRIETWFETGEIIPR